MITRKEYMKTPEGRTAWCDATEAQRAVYRAEDRARHRRYYGQFVTGRTADAVAKQIGGSRILASTDEHLNDIPLHQWDRVWLDPDVIRKLVRANGSGGYAPADIVCIAKEAARQWAEDQHPIE